MARPLGKKSEDLDTMNCTFVDSGNLQANGTTISYKFVPVLLNNGQKLIEKLVLK